MMAPGKQLAWTILLAVSLTGCSLLHKQPAQQAQAPPLQTGQGALQQQEQQQHQAPPPSSPPQTSAQATPPPLPPAKQRKVKRPKKPKPAEPTQSSPPVQQAANSAPAPPSGSATPVSAIGQLTGGDSATEEQTKRDTVTLISTTERGLQEIKRALSSEEQTTAAQIRAFLDQAKKALANGDSDGAHTLATKAKLLLEELIKS